MLQPIKTGPLKFSKKKRWLTYALPVPGISGGKDLSNTAQLTSLSAATREHPTIMCQEHQMVISRTDLQHWDITQ